MPMKITRSVTLPDDEYDRIAMATVAFIRRRWESKRGDIIHHLMRSIHGPTGTRAYTRKGAERATETFIDSMVYVAEAEAKSAAKLARQQD